VRNLGSATARAVRVRVRLPRTLKHLKGGRRRKGSRTVVMSLGNIGAGKGRSRAISARVTRVARAGRKITLRARVTLEAPSAAAATAAMPTVRAAAGTSRPRQRFVAAYGLCRIVIRD